MKRPTMADFDSLADKLPGVGTDPASVRRRVEAMEGLLERMFVVPGINIPVVGPTIAAVMGSWLVWEARNLGLSKWQMTRMFGNVGIDLVLGAIPWVGAIPDFFFRSNSRNLKLLKRHLDRHHPATATIEGGVVGRR
jgi:hypothetical protein